MYGAEQPRSAEEPEHSFLGDWAYDMLAFYVMLLFVGVGCFWLGVIAS